MSLVSTWQLFLMTTVYFSTLFFGNSNFYNTNMLYFTAFNLNNTQLLYSKHMYSVFFTYILKDTLKKVSFKIKRWKFNDISNPSTLKRVSYYLCCIKLVAILFFSKFNNKNEQLTFQRVALCLIQYKMLHFTSVTIFFFLIFWRKFGVSLA